MIDFNVLSLQDKCSSFGLELNNEAVERLELYGNLLLEWNEKMNLTAITEPGEVLYKHFFDCLLTFGAYDIKEGAKIIDVGTGAGFPGMVLKIARPDIDLTLIDGLNKRTVFLNEVANKLSLNVKIHHIRAEDAGKTPEFREMFDIACARAVAKLNTLCEYCIPFVKKGGVFIALKGADVDAEVKESINAFKILGCETPEIKKLNLREDEKRSFVIAKKVSQTPPKYPRNSSKITKSAL